MDLIGTLLVSSGVSVGVPLPYTIGGAVRVASRLHVADFLSGRYHPITMTGADFRRIALSMAGAAEGSHFGNPDFRVGGRIFATLSLERQGYGVLMLSPEQQAGMVQDEPDVFSPVPGGWGRNGSTRVLLSRISPEVLGGALRIAWQNRVARNAPKRKSGLQTL